MSKRRRIDIYLSEDAIRWLQDMATRNGMTTKQHTGIPRGNISGFLEAIAAGRLTMTGNAADASSAPRASGGD
jgi:hypothetical protein